MSEKEPILLYETDSIGRPWLVCQKCGRKSQAWSILGKQRTRCRWCGFEHRAREEEKPLKEMTVKRLKRYKGKIGIDLAISIVEQECEREAERLKKRLLEIIQQRDEVGTKATMMRFHTLLNKVLESLK